MKIIEIELDKYRGIKHTKLQLNGSSAIIYGINGAGKTSILTAITTVMSKILSEAAWEDEQIDVENITLDDIYLGNVDSKIELKLGYAEDTISVYRKRDEESIKKSKSIEQLAKMLQKSIGTLSEEGTSSVLALNDKNIPIFVNYGINRLDRMERVYKKDTNGTDKLDAWRDSICEGRININKFFEWFRSRQEAENFKKINANMDFEDIQLAHVKKAILNALGEDFSDIYYKVGDRSGMYFVKNNKEFSAKQLSDGELNIAVLIGDISRRLSIANPGLGDSSMGEGIILIDEIDIHIHPQWQERIFEVLTRSFPNIQFIASTHSPKIINSLDDDIKLISMEVEEGDNVAKIVDTLNGWDVNDIMSRYMGTSVLNPDTKKLIDDLREALDLRDIETAKKLRDELARKTSTNNVEVVRASMVIGGNIE